MIPGVALIVAGLCWLAYAYIVYPTMIAGVARRRLAPSWPAHVPRVVMIISAFNEAGVIAEKVANTLSLEYPRDHLRVFVSSDGSTDGTVAIAREAARGHGHIQVVSHAKNVGKTASLVATLRQIDLAEEVVVLSDANAMYRSDALRHLVAPFSDPSVGLVAGELQYEDESAEGAYRTYENGLKQNESLVAGCLTAEGSIFAVRTVLIPQLRSDEIEDVAIPLAVAISGARVLYEPRALSIERFGLTPLSQYARRRRIVSRAVRTTWRYRAILNPRRVGILSWMYFSHKLLRWFSPFAVLLTLSGLASVGISQLSGEKAALVIVVALAAGIGGPYALRNHPRLSIAWAGVVAFAAMTTGVVAASRGRTVVTWEPARPNRV